MSELNHYGGDGDIVLGMDAGKFVYIDTSLGSISRLNDTKEGWDIIDNADFDGDDDITALDIHSTTGTCAVARGKSVSIYKYPDVSEAIASDILTSTLDITKIQFDVSGNIL